MPNPDSPAPRCKTCVSGLREHRNNVSGDARGNITVHIADPGKGSRCRDPWHDAPPAESPAPTQADRAYAESIAAKIGAQVSPVEFPAIRVRCAQCGFYKDVCKCKPVESPAAGEMCSTCGFGGGSPNFCSNPFHKTAAGEGLIERVHDYACSCRGTDLAHRNLGDPRCLSLRAAVREAIDEARDEGWPPILCDEPGCKYESTCGWPSPSGYRRTCGDHWVRP